MLHRLAFHLLFSLVVVFWVPSFSFAAEVSKAAPSAPPAAENNPAAHGGEGVTTQIEDVQYSRVDVFSMNKLMWALGVYNPSSPDDINTFMRVTECPLFQKFYDDDITWEKIKKSMTNYLNENRSDVSWRYEYTFPATLGRYDENLSGFPLIDGTDMLSVKSIEIINFSGNLDQQIPCVKGIYGPLRFPASVILKTKSPLTLSFIRVSKAVAGAYLDRLQVEGINGRPVYLRLRFVVSDLEGVKGEDDRDMIVSVRGRVERVDAFADQELMLPIFGQDF
ncbi:MAG: DUF4852 domain-containing protein [Pseudobdellovibrionaceae bacterium]